MSNLKLRPSCSCATPSESRSRVAEIPLRLALQGRRAISVQSLQCAAMHTLPDTNSAVSSSSNAMREHTKVLASPKAHGKIGCSHRFVGALGGPPNVFPILNNIDWNDILSDYGVCTLKPLGYALAVQTALDRPSVHIWVCNRKGEPQTIAT